VHPNPEQALSDKYQAINYDAFASLQNQLNALLQVMKGGEITPVTVL
jgi:3-deoxy-D-arabino-heptulosonate 7-phosphate (DAHP) synthase